MSFLGRARSGAAVIVLFGAAFARAGSREPRAITVVDGQELGRELAPRAGRPLLVHLWASWCVPCVAEWPALAEDLRDFAGREVDIVVVSIDDVPALGAAEKVLGKVGRFPGTSLLAPPTAALPAVKALDPEWDGAIPATWLLDGHGKVALALRGGTRLDLLEREVDRLAPESRSSHVSPSISNVENVNERKKP